MRALLLALPLLLAACGLHPLHSRTYQESLAVDLSQVGIDTDSSRLGQLLKAEIQDQVAPVPGRKPVQYRLKITISELDIPLFINSDGTSSRGDLQYQSQYSLVRLSDNKTIANGSMARVASYSSSQNADYASFVSKEDSRQRAVIELAQDYKLRIANLLPLINDPNAGEAKPLAAPTANIIPSVGDPNETRSKGF